MKLGWSRVVPVLVLISMVGAACTRSASTAPSDAENGMSPSSRPPAAASGARTPAANPSASRTSAPSSVFLEVPGKVSFPRTERLYFETSGTLERLSVEEGASVRVGERIAALDTSTVVSLQKQVAAARVALDDAEKALKEERERFLPGDVQALRARVAQLQKDFYVLQQSLDDARETYREKLEQKLGVPVPVALLDRPPEQLADALIAQIGVKPFWGVFQEHARRLLEVPWEQMSQLRSEILQLEQSLLSQQRVLDDLVNGATLAKLQAELQVAKGKVETAHMERATAVLKQKGAAMQRETALARRNAALLDYRDKVRDLLGLTVDRELANGFYIHSSFGWEEGRTDLGKRMAGHVQLLLGRPLQSESLGDALPESLLRALLASQDGQDHVIDFFLRQKAADAWLTLQKARQDVPRLAAARTQAAERFTFPQRRTADATTSEAAWANLQVADRQLEDAMQKRDAARTAYRQLFLDYLNVDLDKDTQLIWDEEPPERLLRRLLDSRPRALSIAERLRRELTDEFQTTWLKIYQAELDRQEGDLGVQRAGVSVQQADLALRVAEESVRQAQNNLDDVVSKATYNRLDAQKQASLSKLRQLQDRLKDAGDQYSDIAEDYLGPGLSGSVSQLALSPDALLKSNGPADTPGFRRFKKDVILLAQVVWGQIQKSLEDTGKSERMLKQTKDDLADALRGPDPLIVARREQEVALARKTIEDLERKLAGVVLNAPFNGVIRRVPLDRGDPVQAYQTVAEIVDLSVLEVEITTDELDLAHLAPGMAVQVRMEAFPAQTFPGRLVSVNPAPRLLGTTLQYQARVRVDSAPAISLYEGMSARVKIELPPKPAGPAR